jgi:hypothetical protein
VTATEWVLTVLLVLDLVMYLLTRAVNNRLIRSQRDLIKSQDVLLELAEDRRRMLAGQVEALWPLYRAYNPAAPVQPPHVVAELSVAAASLQRQTNNEDKAES